MTAYAPQQVGPAGPGPPAGWEPPVRPGPGWWTGVAVRADVTAAVIEVDELHLAAVAARVNPAVIVLNLSRDQLDRSTEAHGVAAAPAVPPTAHEHTRGGSKSV